jgi:cell division septation protein DedD
MKKYCRILTAISVAAVVASYGSVANSATYGNALAQMRSGSYQLARSQFLTLAEQGNQEARFQLGLMAHIGRGIPPNYADARKWYLRAAKTGEIRSMNNLGVLYRDGLGVSQDRIRAYKWFGLAAAQGNTKAVSNLSALVHDMNKADIQHGQRLAQLYYGETNMAPIKVAAAPLVTKSAPARPAAVVRTQLEQQAEPTVAGGASPIIAILKAIMAPLTRDTPTTVTKAPEKAKSEPQQAAKAPEEIKSRPEVMASAPTVVATQPKLVARTIEAATSKPKVLVQTIEVAKAEASKAEPNMVAKTLVTPTEQPVATVEKPKTPVARIDRGKYVVQLGLFRNRNNVVRILAKLKSRGIMVIAEDVKLGGSGYKRLRVGPYASKGRARRISGLVNKVFGIRSLVLFQGPSSQAEAVRSNRGNL